MRPGLAVIISTTRGSFGPYATAALQVITPFIMRFFRVRVSENKRIFFLANPDLGRRGKGDTAMAQAKGRAFKVRETGGCLVPRGPRMLPGALSGQQATLCKPSPPSPALFSPPSAAAAGGVLRNHVSRKRVGRKSVAGTGALGGMPGRVLGGGAPGIVVSAHSAEVRSAGRRQARRLGWLAFSQRRGQDVWTASGLPAAPPALPP